MVLRAALGIWQTAGPLSEQELAALAASISQAPIVAQWLAAPARAAGPLNALFNRRAARLAQLTGSPPADAASDIVVHKSAEILTRAANLTGIRRIQRATSKACASNRASGAEALVRHLIAALCRPTGAWGASHTLPGLAPVAVSAELSVIARASVLCDS